MESDVACPICTMTDVIDAVDGGLECVTCGHEWTPAAVDGGSLDGLGEIRDANGNVLSDGDSVTLIKSLKLKGSSDTLKIGTRVNKIRLVSGDHEIDCKVDGRAILLKAEYVKKA